MQKLEENIVKEISSQIENYMPHLKTVSTGKIIKIGDGIATIDNLSSAAVGEVLEFPKGIKGMALNLRKGEVGAIIFGDYSLFKEGDEVLSTGKILSISVSPSLLGRVVNPMIEAIDGGSPLNFGKEVREMLIEKIAPGIVYREPVNAPLQTGIKSVDSMTPIGRGQRELIIGDRNTGKTAIAIDTIINQAKENRSKVAKRVISIYVAIGQKQSKIAQVVSKLEEMDAMDATIVVSAGSADPVAYQYIAPYSGCAIAEYFMEKGEDVLIVYDDLSKHAWAYRQISLILRRPSG